MNDGEVPQLLQRDPPGQYWHPLHLVCPSGHSPNTTGDGVGYLEGEIGEAVGRMVGCPEVGAAVGRMVGYLEGTRDPTKGMVGDEVIHSGAPDGVKV